MKRPSARHPIPGEYVRLWNGELAVVLGKSEIPDATSGAKWDGSYRVQHEDGTVGYWYPTRLVCLGTTIY